MKFKKSLLATVVAGTVAMTSMSAMADSLSFKQSEMESDLENRLRQNINAFISNNKYSLNVDVDLEYNDITPETPETVSPSFADSILEAQKICDSLLNIGSQDSQPSDKLGAMPALPGFGNTSGSEKTSQTNTSQQLIQALVQMKMMEQCNAQFANLSAQSVKTEKPTVIKEIAIKSIDVDLTVDDEVTAELVQLLKGNIALKADINPDRGDKITINQIDFDGEALKASVGPASEFITKHYPWIFGLGIVALMALYMMMRNRNQPATVVARSITAGSSSKQEYDSQAQANTAMNELVKLNMSSPELLVELKADSSKAALIDSAKPAVYLLRGKNGIRNLFGDVSEVSMDEIITRSKSIEPQDAQSAIEMLSSELVNMPKIKAQKESLTPYKFLENLDSGQIFDLIRNENASAASIVLTQLPSLKAAEVLRSYEGSERANLIVQLSTTKQFDSTDMISIAEGLADRARKLPKLSNVAAPGMKITSEIIDCFNEQEQIERLNEIRAVSPAQYIEIREKIFLWQDITRIDKSALGSVIMDVDPDNIAAALAPSIQDERDYVIGTMTAGLKKRVTNILNNSEDESAGGIKTLEARSEIVRVIRSAIDNGFISKSEISPLKFTTDKD